MRTLIDLFAGCGGLSTGLKKAGFTPIFFNELVPDFANTYLRNHPLPNESYFIGDIRELNLNINKYLGPLLNQYKEIDLICGGPPCQGFSNANRQRLIYDERNFLYKEFLCFLRFVRPRFFIMENVRGMANKYNQIVKDFEEYLGCEYSYDFRLLNAKDFGIPQNRLRFIMIGTRTNIDISKIFDKLETYKCKQFLLKDALAGLPLLHRRVNKNRPSMVEPMAGVEAIQFEYEITDFYRFINGDKIIPMLYNHRNRYNNERDCKIFALLPQGANSLHPSIKHLMPYQSRNHIFKDKYYKLKEDEVCKTITSHMRYDCNMYIHPTQPRGLSPREAARIQTFPDDYIFTGPPNSWYAQIGNAVPVKFAEVIGNAIITTEI